MQSTNWFLTKGLADRKIEELQCPQEESTWIPLPGHIPDLRWNSPGCFQDALSSPFSSLSLSLSLSLFPSLASLLPSAYERQRLGFGVYIQHSIGIGGYVCILPVRITERRSMPWCCWPDVRAQGYRNTRQAEDQQKKKRKVLEESRRRDATR